MVTTRSKLMSRLMSLRLRTISSPQIFLQDGEQRAILNPFASAVLILGVTPAAFLGFDRRDVAIAVHQFKLTDGKLSCPALPRKHFRRCRHSNTPQGARDAGSANRLKSIGSRSGPRG